MLAWLAFGVEEPVSALEKLTGSAELEDAAASTARALVQFYRQPENQAFMVGCFLTAGLFAGRYRPVAGTLLTLCGGLAGRQVYRASADLRALARAAGDGSATPLA